MKMLCTAEMPIAGPLYKVQSKRKILGVFQ